MQEFDEAEIYAIAGLFTLALHACSAAGELSSDQDADSWGEEVDDNDARPLQESSAEEDLAFWGRDLVTKGGLLEHVYQELQLPPHKWSGLMALPTVAPSTDCRAHYHAVKSLVSVLDPELAGALPDLLAKPQPRHQQLQEQEEEEPIITSPPLSPLSPTENIQKPNMGATDRLWDGLLTSSDDEEFKIDVAFEKAVEAKQQRRHQSQPASAVTSPGNGSAALGRRESLEAQELLKTLSDTAASAKHDEVNHTELIQTLQQLELDNNQSTDSAHLVAATTSTKKEEPEPSTQQKEATTASPSAVAALWELLQCTVAAAPTTEATTGTVPKRWYDARSRVALRQVAVWLQLPWRKVITLEVLLGSDKAPITRHNKIDASATEQVNKMRYLKVGLAAGAGGVLFAVTGGLAAPAIAAGVGSIIGLIPGASAAAATVGGFMGTSAGLAAVTGTTAGAGAATTGSKMAHRTAEIKEFGFLELPDVGEQGASPFTSIESAADSASTSSGIDKQSSPSKKSTENNSRDEALPVLLSKRLPSEGIRLSAVVCISGWITQKEDFELPWRRLHAPASDRFACVWESAELKALDNALGSLLAKQVAGQAVQLGVKHLLAAGAGLVAALAPTVIVGTAAGLVISNSWAVCMDRAEKAGKILAQLLIAGGAGDRPVALVAHGMGARLAFHCCLELCRRGARGIISDCLLLGAPVSRSEERWRMARRAVAGRLINGWSKNDWLLSVLCWDGGGLAAGLAPIQIEGVENVCLGCLVSGHLDYLDKIEEIADLIQLEL